VSSFLLRDKRSIESSKNFTSKIGENGNVWVYAQQFHFQGCFFPNISCFGFVREFRDFGSYGRKMEYFSELRHQKESLFSLGKVGNFTEFP
jgi:hypothetical protein